MGKTIEFKRKIRVIQPNTDQDYYFVSIPKILAEYHAVKPGQKVNVKIEVEGDES